MHFDDVFVEDVCVARDPKGIYRLSRAPMRSVVASRVRQLDVDGVQPVIQRLGERAPLQQWNE
jgi:hypothetical protein